MIVVQHLRFADFAPYFLMALLAPMPFIYQGSSATTGTLNDLAVENIAVAQSTGSSEHPTGRAITTVQSSVTNSGQLAKSIAYVVQVKNASNHVVFISFTTLSIGSQEMLPMATTWSSTEGGDYSVQVFAWENVDSPPGLSYGVTRVRIDPQGQPEQECMGTATCLKAVVIRVIDGDTIDVSEGVRVRLSLVDTPERGADGYQKATEFTEQVCPVGSEVLVDEDDEQTSGSYGRLVGKVYCEGGIINEMLLESQNAVILGEFCEGSEFSRDDWAVKFGCEV
jgi:hypothetical protein